MISIVIPTLTKTRAEKTGALAKLTAGCDTNLIVSYGPRDGFSKAVNRGLAQTNREDVCILNDDILWFSPMWLEVLRRGLHVADRCGVVGPTGRSSTAPMKHGWFGQTGIMEVDHLPFWCVLVKRKAFDAAGYLDEAFIHYGSDNWFCWTIAQHGMTCAWVKDVFLEHEHHGSGMIQEWKDHDDLVMKRKARRLR